MAAFGFFDFGAAIDAAKEKQKGKERRKAQRQARRQKKKAVVVADAFLDRRKIIRGGSMVDLGEFKWMLNPMMVDGAPQLPPIPLDLIIMILVFAKYKPAYHIKGGIRTWVYLAPIDSKAIEAADAASAARQTRRFPALRASASSDEFDDYGPYGHRDGCCCPRCEGIYLDWDESDYYGKDERDLCEDPPLTSAELDALDAHGQYDEYEDEMAEAYKEFCAMRHVEDGYGAGRDHADGDYACGDYDDRSYADHWGDEW
jgi:hypothetical protein